MNLKRKENKENLRELSHYLIFEIMLLNFSSRSTKVRMNHHASDECQIFKDNRGLLTENEIADILLVLRLWLIKYKNPLMWKEINRMEAHLDKRIGTSVWKDRETNVINVSLLKQIVHIIRTYYMFINSIYYI